MIQRYTKFLMCAIEFPHNFSFAWYCLCLLLRQVTLFTLVGALLIFARGQFLPLLRSRRRLFSASGNMGFAHLLKHATSYSTIAATTHNRKIGRTGAWQSLLGFVIVRKGRGAVFFHFPWRWLLTSTSSSLHCCWTYVRSNSLDVFPKSSSDKTFEEEIILCRKKLIYEKISAHPSLTHACVFIMLLTSWFGKKWTFSARKKPITNRRTDRRSSTSIHRTMKCS